MLFDTNITIVLDDIITMFVGAMGTCFSFLRTTFYSFHGFRLSLFDFCIAMIVLSAFCHAIFPHYADESDEE